MKMNTSPARLKRRRKRARRVPTSERTVPRGTSVYGRKIWEAMQAAKIKGNYKDFVLFVGDQLYDRFGQYTVLRPNAPPDQHFCLVHKSKLKPIIGEEWANKFWDFKWKRRTSFGLEGYQAGRQARKQTNA
ncbi:MAG: hypothetical protein ACWGQW_00750 [bacterium]